LEDGSRVELHRRKGVHLFGAYNINQAEIFNNGFVDGLQTVKVGGQSSLMNQLMRQTPADAAMKQVRTPCAVCFATELSQNSVAALAATLARRTASGVPLPVASGLGATLLLPLPAIRRV